MSSIAVRRQTIYLVALIGLAPLPARAQMRFASFPQLQSHSSSDNPNVSPMLAPMGTTVLLQTEGDGGMLRSTGKTYQLGMAATFQLQELASGPPGTAHAGQMQFAGMIQFAAGNPQAGQIGNCTENRCGVSTLVITSVTALGTTSYKLHNTSITQVSLGSPVTAAFSFDGIDSKAHGPETSSPVMSLNDEPSAPPLPTFGVFVTAQGAKGKPQSLGVASVFQLQGIPAPANAAAPAVQTAAAAAPAGPNAGTPTPTGPNAGRTAPPAANAGPPATGTIQFAPDGQQAPEINSCFLKRCLATVTIRNATPQGATLYTLHNVSFTQMVIGPMVTVAFTYTNVEWQTFAPGSKKPAQSGTWNYLAGAP